jgi:hypothetical protein
MNTIIYAGTIAAIVGVWQGNPLIGALVFGAAIYGAIGLRWMLKTRGE